MTSVTIVATMCYNSDPGFCGLPSSWDNRERQTDRHERAHKVFFAHARAWRTPKMMVIPWSAEGLSGLQG
jgi:hypothetical protein